MCLPHAVNRKSCFLDDGIDHINLVKKINIPNLYAEVVTTKSEIIKIIIRF